MVWCSEVRRVGLLLLDCHISWRMLLQKVLVSGSKGFLLLVLDSTQVWWIRTRLKFDGLGLDSSLVDSDSTRAFSNGLGLD